MEANVREAFERVYGTSIDHLYFAPGRINLIGEHIDYNGGLVFPCAISYGTYLAIKKRSDRTCRLYSENFPQDGIQTIHLDDLSFDKEDGWVSFPKGVMAIFEKHGMVMDHGFDLFYWGTIPNGAGLSSSASITMATSWMLVKEFGFSATMIDCALFTKEVENDYIGVNTGIMDQFVIGMGQKDKAILLKTDTLDYQYVPLVLGDASLVIMNTNKQRTLADSKYNQRLEECHKALALLQTKRPISHLCDLTMDQFNEIKDVLDDPILLKRARHAVSENERTKQAKEVLDKNDLAAFGQLMNQSHASLRDDYEVTGIELDTLQEAAVSLPDTYGARVTGAGFGGCAIALVKTSGLDNFIDHVQKVYQEKMSYPASFYVVSVGQGTHQIV